jgi:hypothetical protein
MQVPFTTHRALTNVTQAYPIALECSDAQEFEDLSCQDFGARYLVYQHICTYCPLLIHHQYLRHRLGPPKVHRRPD